MLHSSGGTGHSLWEPLTRQHMRIWAMFAGNWHSNQGVLDANTVPVINPDGDAAADQVRPPSCSSKESAACADGGDT